MFVSGKLAKTGCYTPVPYIICVFHMVLSNTWDMGENRVFQNPGLIQIVIKWPCFFRGSLWYFVTVCYRSHGPVEIVD